MNCHFCGEPIATTKTAYRYVHGWEHPRSAGGTNALALREPQNKWAHPSCVDKEKHGISPDQLSFA